MANRSQYCQVSFPLDQLQSMLYTVLFSWISGNNERRSGTLSTETFLTGHRSEGLSVDQVPNGTIAKAIGLCAYRLFSERLH